MHAPYNSISQRCASVYRPRGQILRHISVRDCAFTMLTVSAAGTAPVVALHIRFRARSCVHAPRSRPSRPSELASPVHRTDSTALAHPASVIGDASVSLRLPGLPVLYRERSRDE